MLNAVLGFIVGVFLGSLVDCLAERSLTNQSFWGRSYCPKCKKTLRWYDLFPILSYLFLRGKCRYCHTRIPVENLLLEILMGLIIALLFSQHLSVNLLTLSWAHSGNIGLSIVNNSPILLLLADLIFEVFVVCILMILFLTDLKEGLIPDRISIPAIIVALGYLFLSTIFKMVIEYFSLLNSTLGKYLLPPHTDFLYRRFWLAADPLLWALIASAIIALFFGGLIFFTRGRGMGGGDLKLGIFMGLVLGYPNAVVALLLAFISGSIVGLGLIVARTKTFKQTIPFGPFLTLGGIVALIWGSQIVNWYSAMFVGGSSILP